MKTKAFAFLIALSSTAAVARPAPPQETAETRVVRLADAFVAARAAIDPGLVYDARLQAGPSAHEKLPDRSPQALRRFDSTIDSLGARLAAIDRGELSGAARVMHALLDEELQSSQSVRVCRLELWDVSHFESALGDAQNLAARQPVGTPALRRAALQRWRNMPRFIDQQLANLRRGIAAGYSVPKPVVARVILQVDRTIAQGIAKSPFYSPALRDTNQIFTAQMRSVVGQSVLPAMQRYRDFLQQIYLPRARDTLGIWDLPKGRQCYRALTRRYTTLDRTTDQFWAMAAPRNSAGIAIALRLGRARYGLSDLNQILARARSDPQETYKSPDQMLAEAQSVVTRARTAFVPLFRSLPTQGVDVRAYPLELQGTGLPHQLKASTVPGGPLTYLVPTERFDQVPRSTNITASLHEAVPGHMLVSARAGGGFDHPLFRLSRLAAFNEGWAQYSETLGDAGGIKLSDTGRIILSPVDGRGVLLDIGIHAGGWTRDQLLAFYTGNGGNPRQFEDRLLRHAAFPAQSIAYDVGKAEILALRAEAERALGPRFDVREFHDAVLAEGPVPLWLLRENIEAWIARGGVGPAAP